ncbi:hypothetical protein N7365_01825 [Pseudomonas sediminis]|uniref:DUF2232 domain-containing protein n=1 Tax=Pseudomonas sediminis TaxID=1691904 RepID=UPI00244948D4|nr:hypothetical protein [Pseudomonas sediminis]MDG9756845.1 hypothetical protein [Pseudomonas sediminis]
MRALAEYIMRGRMQATLVVVGSAIVPLFAWLGAAAGALVLLRRGLSDALGIVIWAVLPAAYFCYLGDPSVLMVVLGTLALAQVLRRSASWVRVLMALVPIGVVFALVVSVALVENLEAMAEVFRQAFAELPAQSAGGPSSEQLQSMQQVSLVPLLSGLMTFSLLTMSILSLVLARYWQASLYNPGGFGEEFRHIRLPVPFALALIAGVFLAPSLLGDAGWAFTLVCMLPLMLAGLALGHGLIAMKQLSSFWSIGLYVALLMAANLICLLAVVDSLFDFRGRLARKNGPGSANGEG